MAHVERGREVEVHQLPLDGGGDLAAAMAGIDAPEAGRAVDHLAAVDGGVVHALGGSEQPRRFLELPVGRERHPERIGLQGVRLLMKGHGVAPVLAAQATTGPRSGSHNKSFSAVLQPIDFTGHVGAYLFDPKHLQQGFRDERRYRWAAPLRSRPSQAVAARAGEALRRDQFDDFADRIQPDEPLASARSSASSTACRWGSPNSSRIEPERPRKAFYRSDELTEIGKKPISYPPGRRQSVRPRAADPERALRAGQRHRPGAAGA